MTTSVLPNNNENKNILPIKISLALESAILQIKHICLSIDEFAKYSPNVQFTQIIDQISLVVDFLVVLKGFIPQMNELQKIQVFSDNLYSILKSLLVSQQKNDPILVIDILENELKLNLIQLENFFEHYNNLTKNSQKKGCL